MSVYFSLKSIKTGSHYVALKKKLGHHVDMHTFQGQIEVILAEIIFTITIFRKSNFIQPN